MVIRMRIPPVIVHASQNGDKYEVRELYSVSSS